MTQVICYKITIVLSMINTLADHLDDGNLTVNQAFSSPGASNPGWRVLSIRTASALCQDGRASSQR